jgi:alpha-tubulin suppressor-like RCC1 family protein
MKKTLSLITAALILSTLILSSCKPQNKIDYSSDKSDLVITADGTTIFLTDTGEVYGLGRNVAYSLGLGHDNKVETAIKISIEEPIVKISVQENQVYYFAESGSIYRTGKKEYPEKLDLSDIEEKIVDISWAGGVLYLLTDSNKVYKRSEVDENSTETLEIPEKIIEIQCTDSAETVWFLTENAKLYMTGGFGDEKEEKPVLKAEDVIDFMANSQNVYCLNNKGEVFGTGVFANEFSEIRAGFTEATVGDKAKKDKDSLWAYTDEFWKLDIKESVKFILDYGPGGAFIALSGRVYVFGYEGACPLGRTDNRGVNRTELFINDIDNIDRIITSGSSHSGGLKEYTHAVKRFGEEWVFAAKDREEISIKDIGF